MSDSEPGEIEQLEERVAVLRQRQRDLERGYAIQGPTSPAHLSTDIESIRAEIRSLERQIAQSKLQGYAFGHVACPYPGMAPFRTQDARFFYGRDGEIQQLLLHLRHHRCLFVIGPSGSGKSSLIFAGLLPRLQQSPYFPQGFWLARTMRPGIVPVQALEQAIGGDLTEPEQAIAELLAAHPPAQRLLLVVDQFEELFSQAQRSEQSRFIAALRRLRALEHCALLIAMRADFYADLINSELWPVSPDQRLEIAPLRGEALRQAIVQPAADVGVALEPGLVDRLLTDVADEPGALPLIQETMTILWIEMRDHVLHLSTYERLRGARRSGLAVALAAKADATLNDFTPAQRQIACRIFLRLVQFGEGRSDTRRQQLIEALRSPGDDPLLFDGTLAHLVDNRLLTLSGGERSDERKVDLAHEALINGWPTLQQWIMEQREAEQTRRRLDAKVAEWQRLGRGRGGLLDEVELQETEHWLASRDAAELGFAADLPALVQASKMAIAEAERVRDVVRQDNIELLRAATSSTNQAARLKAIASLGEHSHPQAVDVLLEALKQHAPPNTLRVLLPGSRRQERTEMRQAIAEALGRIGDGRAVEVLVAQLKDPEPGPRKAAEVALGQIRASLAADELNKEPQDLEAQAREATTRGVEQTDPAPESSPAEASVGVLLPISRAEALARLAFTRTDLLDLDADAWVHSTGPRLGFGGGTGQKLLSALGPAFAYQIEALAPIKLGEALVTPVEGVRARYIIHVPIYDDATLPSRESVTRAVRAALRQAEALPDVYTLVFSSIGVSWGQAEDFAPHVVLAVAEHLEQGSRIERVTFSNPNAPIDDAYRAAFQALGGAIVPELPERATYRLALSAPPQATVGEQLRLNVELLPAGPGQNVIELPQGAADLHCFVSAEGLRVLGSDAAPMPRDPATGRPAPASFALQAQLRGQRAYTVDLFVEDPTTGRLLITQARGQISVAAPTPGVEPPPIRPTLDIRVADRPDFVLRVLADPLAGAADTCHLTYRLDSHLPGVVLRDRVVGHAALRAADLDRMQALLHAALIPWFELQPEDAWSRLRSLGVYLYDLLFPPEGAAELRAAFWRAADKLTTWLIVEDGVSWQPLPWELIAPYRAEGDAPAFFLAERYQIGRWLEGFGTPLYGEVPLGELALAHYKILEPGQERADEELLAWQRLLSARYVVQGISRIARPEEPIYGLHLLRHADQAGARRSIAARESSPALAPEQEAPRARLDLRLKRPVVTLSILADPGRGHDGTTGWLLPERALPFLKSGAGAVAGPWWPTAEEADQIFWPTFYDLLSRRGLRLGEAVWRARLAVRAALPQRPDWLAYTLFGDPRARPYWPLPSEGYTVLECLNPDQPLRPGKTYRFRASIRSRPPLWYQERLVAAEELPAQVQALFLAPGLRAGAEPMEMRPAGRTMLQATVELTPPKPGDYRLVVKLLEGDEHLKTLRLTLNVRDLPPGETTHA